MKRWKMADSSLDKSIVNLATGVDHRILAIWAADCAERALPLFEELRPRDPRPRRAIEALREWVTSGVFRMADVRRTALDAHAAARDVQGNDAARSAARAAGQAMATAHVPSHALAAAIYAATAFRDAAATGNEEGATMREREWQFCHLLEMIGASES